MNVSAEPGFGLPLQSSNSGCVRLCCSMQRERNKHTHTHTLAAHTRTKWVHSVPADPNIRIQDHIKSWGENKGQPCGWRAVFSHTHTHGEDDEVGSPLFSVIIVLCLFLPLLCGREIQYKC